MLLGQTSNSWQILGVFLAIEDLPAGMRPSSLSGLPAKVNFVWGELVQQTWECCYDSGSWPGLWHTWFFSCFSSGRHHHSLPVFDSFGLPEFLRSDIAHDPGSNQRSVCWGGSLERSLAWSLAWRWSLKNPIHRDTWNGRWAPGLHKKGEPSRLSRSS